MSTFVSQRTKEIFQNASIDEPGLESPPLPGYQTRQPCLDSQKELQSTLAGLHTPPNDEQLVHGLEVLNEASHVGERNKDPYVFDIEGRTIAGLYARSLDALLKQALEADNEAMFWWDVERSRYNTAYYLVQSTYSFLYHFICLITLQHFLFVHIVWPLLSLILYVTGISQ